MTKQYYIIIIAMAFCLGLGFLLAKIIYEKDTKPSESRIALSHSPEKQLNIDSTPNLANTSARSQTALPVNTLENERMVIEKMNASAEDIVNHKPQKLAPDEILTNGHIVKQKSIIGEWIGEVDGRNYLLRVSPYRFVYLEECEKNEIAGRDDKLKCEKIFEGVVVQDNISSQPENDIKQLKGKLKNYQSQQNSEILLLANSFGLKMNFDEIELSFKRGNKMQIALKVK